MSSGKVCATVVVVSCVYIAIGGLVFRALEKPNDEEQRLLIRTNITNFFNNSSRCIGDQDVKNIIPIIVQAVQYSVDLSANDSDSESNWDFYSSLFFSVTVVTTIGYGNVPLKTEWGRTFCMLYALVGVPLCLFTLFLVGQQEKRFIYFVAKKLFTFFREDKRKLHSFTTFAVSIGGSLVFVWLSAVLFMCVEGWRYVDAVYYCFITLLTIGFGDYVAGWSPGGALWYRLLIGVWIILGLSWCTILVSACQDIYMDLCEKTRKVAGAVENRIESKVKSTIDGIAADIRKEEIKEEEQGSTVAKLIGKAKHDQPDSRKRPPSLTTVES